MNPPLSKLLIDLSTAASKTGENSTALSRHALKEIIVSTSIDEMNTISSMEWILWMSQQGNISKVTHQHLVFTLNEWSESLPEMWSTSLGDALFHRIQPHHWPNLNFAGCEKFWNGWFKHNDPSTWIHVDPAPSRFIPNSERHRKVSWANWRKIRQKAGIDESITPTHPASLSWFFARVLGENFEKAEELVKAGLRWNVEEFSKQAQASPEAEIQVKFLYHSLFIQRNNKLGRGTHPDLLLNPPQDVEKQEFLTNDQAFEDDKVLGRQWGLLLDAGVPSLSSLGLSVRTSPAVAHLEFERGGMRRGSNAIKDWLGLSLMDWPFGKKEILSPIASNGQMNSPSPVVDLNPHQAPPKLSSESALNWAIRHGVDFSSLSSNMLAQWIHKKEVIPPKANRLIQAISVHFDKFPLINQTHSKQKDENEYNVLEEAIRTGVNSQSIRILLDLGASLDEPFGKNHLLGSIIAHSPKDDRQEIFEMMVERLGPERVKNQLNTSGFYGQTILHVAMQQLDMGILDWLIDQGLSLNMQDHNGDTPAHRLAQKTSQKKKEKIIDLYGWLETNGVDWTLKNNVGETVFDRLEKSGYSMDKQAIYSIIEQKHLERILQTAPPKKLPRIRL